MIDQDTCVDAARLAEVVHTTRVVVVCGTGGVGKTTVSAALALGVALKGKRALVMTIDPARRLADALGLTARLNEETPIDVEALLGEPPPPGGSLSAMMLDAKRTFDEVVERFAKDDETKQRILANRYYQRATQGLSGSQEYMAMEQLLKVVNAGEYDVIVLDTPPSRNALDFLDAPSRMVSMLADGALRWLRVPEGSRFSAARAGRAIFGKGRQAMFAIFERFLGADVIQGISEFVTAFSGLLDGMRSRADQVLELLRSSDTAFLMVASPSRISLSEALYFNERLSEIGIPFRGFVINRMRPTNAELLSLPKDPDESFPPRLGDEQWWDAVEAVWRNHRRRARWAAVDRHHINALKSHCCHDIPFVEIPEIEGQVHDLGALRRMLDYLR